MRRPDREAGAPRVLAYPDPALADQRVVLRPWRDEDVACVREQKRCERAAALRWIELQERRRTDGAGISVAIADPTTDWVLERAQGRGLARSAVSLLSGWALSDAGLVRVEALVEPDNGASRRVLERAGFEREGGSRRISSFSVR